MAVQYDHSNDRLEAKIDKISDKISSIDTTLAAQHQSLADHIRRTEILENEITPIKKHVTMVQATLVIIGALSTLTGLFAAAVHLYSSIKGLK